MALYRLRFRWIEPYSELDLL